MAQTPDVCLSQSGCPGCETMCKTVEMRTNPSAVILCYAAAELAVCRWVSSSRGISQKIKPSLSDDLNVFYFTWYLLSFRNTARRPPASYLGACRALYHFCKAVSLLFMKSANFPVSTLFPPYLQLLHQQQH